MHGTMNIKFTLSCLFPLIVNKALITITIFISCSGHVSHARRQKCSAAISLTITDITNILFIEELSNLRGILNNNISKTLIENRYIQPH